MKTLVSIVCSFMLLSTAFASPLPKTQITSVKFADEFIRMNAHRQQNGVITTWTFSNPGNVSRYVIQRSYDGFFFENIGEVPGGAGRQQYKEDNVFPGYLHYKVVAIMNDGSTVHSSIETVRVVRNG